MHACVHVRICYHLYVLWRVNMRMFMCICVYVSAFLQSNLLVCLPACLPARTPACLSTFLHAFHIQFSFFLLLHDYPLILSYTPPFFIIHFLHSPPPPPHWYRLPSPSPVHCHTRVVLPHFTNTQSRPYCAPTPTLTPPHSTPPH